MCMFLNFYKDKYAWDNDELEGYDMALVEDEIPHPSIAAEIPGVDLASETPAVLPSDTHDDGAIEILDTSQEQLVEATIQNNSLYIVGPDKTPGVPLTVIDLTNSSQECKVIPKQEPRSQFKIGDDESIEDGNNPDEDQFGNLARTEKLGPTMNEDGLRRSNCNIRPPQVTQVSFQNQQYDIDGSNEIVHDTNHMNVDAWNRRGKLSGKKYVEGTMHVNVQYPALFVHNEDEALE